jgi:hypothetical protein
MVINKLRNAWLATLCGSYLQADGYRAAATNARLIAGQEVRSFAGLLRSTKILSRHQVEGNTSSARCARSTVYEAIRVLEQVGVLSSVNRIKSVREYVPRRLRQGHGVQGDPLP